MLRFYRFESSTNVERVALALGHKGIDVESVVVDPEDRSPVLAVSGQELVPVLVDGDVVITDSNRILHHLEALQPDPPLFPADPAARAEVELFIDWFNRVWKREPNLIDDALATGDGDPEDIARWTRRMTARHDWFEALLTGREYLFGEFGAADCAAYPFLRYTIAIPADDPWSFHTVINERMPLADRHVNLRAWLARMAERPQR